MSLHFTSHVLQAAVALATVDKTMTTVARVYDVVAIGILLSGSCWGGLRGL